MAVKKVVRINHCTCLICRGKDLRHPERVRHHQINLLMSVMGVQARRMFAAYEAEKIGLGGISQVARITGLDRKTIRKGRNELFASEE